MNGPYGDHHYKNIQFPIGSQLDLDRNQLLSTTTHDKKVTNLNECSNYSKTVSLMIEEENLSLHKSRLPEYSNQLIKNLETKELLINKIPYVIHHIWINFESPQREINKTDINNIIKNKELFANDFANGANQWNHTLWTNNKNLISHSGKLKKENNIEIRSFQDNKTEFRSIKIIDELIKNGTMEQLREATYLLRYNILERFGGVYADLNFQFNRSIKSEMHKYDFITTDFAGYFFAAKANHPIISNAIDLLERNLVTPPAYINSVDSYNNSFVKEMLISTIPLGLAYLNSSNKNSNIDIVYPSVNAIIPEDITWFDDRKCLAFWEFYNFRDNLGICGANSLLIGQDGTDHMK